MCKLFISIPFPSYKKKFNFSNLVFIILIIIIIIIIGATRDKRGRDSRDPECVDPSLCLVRFVTLRTLSDSACLWPWLQPSYPMAARAQLPDATTADQAEWRRIPERWRMCTISLFREQIRCVRPFSRGGGGGLILGRDRNEPVHDTRERERRWTVT